MAALMPLTSDATLVGANGHKMLHLDLDRVDLERVAHDNSQSNSKRVRAEADDVDITPSQIFDVKQYGYRYQAPIYFGQSKAKAMMAFDTGTSYTTVTSEMCSNCETKAYKQGSGKNHDLDWNLQLNQGMQEVSLNVMTFSDKVCLNDDEEDLMCIGGFQFYPITSQEGLTKHQDGIIGLAPLQQKNLRKHEGPLLLQELKTAEVIDHAIVAMFIADQHSKKRSI